ncbi:mitogen-activated protein kinase-binding protein 1-like [Styela clava]
MGDKSNRSTDLPAQLRRKKSFQGRQYKRRTKPLSEQYSSQLSKVLGLTVRQNCAFACNEATGNVAYPAGSVIVIARIRSNKQFYIFNPGHKSLTCIKFSLDGQYVVTGELGHLPCVRVFSVSEKSQIASFQSHKFGISCVSFSPNSEYIVSIGYQHDNVINVWNWKKNVLAASNKVSVKVRSLAFAEDSSYFVTAGNRHVKFWYIEQTNTPETETVPLKGRSGILGTVRNHLFCDVACGVGCDSLYTYSLTRTGMLCQFNEKRTLENSIQLQASAAFCMSVVNGTIVCGCNDGIILLHSSADLQFLNSFSCSESETDLHDIVVVSMDSQNMWVHCVDTNHIIRVWDVLDFNSPVEFSSCHFHSECIWDIKEIPSPSTDSSSLFYSCSNDATVKMWNLTDDDACVMKSNILVNSSTVSNNGSNIKPSKVGIRTLCVSHDSQYLAVGDRGGFIHIYQLDDSMKLTQVTKVEMHATDLLSLTYDPSDKMLASASRDRCIYILDSNNAPTYTISDHSAAVTAVKFIHLNDKLRLISCGVDKSLYFCTVINEEGRVEITRDQHIVEKHSMHDMTIINDTVLVACGANLREYDIGCGKARRLIRGPESVSTVLRVIADKDGMIVAISCSDKFIYVLNYQTGEFLFELSGHSEICTALAFISNCSDKTLVTTSADSCMFIWKLNRCAQIIEDSTSHSDVQGCLQNDIGDPISEENEVNVTAYFGNSKSIEPFQSDCLMKPDGADNGESDTDENDNEPDEVTSTIEIDMDMSLPTWLTGKKDKIIKGKAPGGKWASRLQNQYNEVSLLDTPRTVMEWEDICADSPEDCDNEDPTALGPDDQNHIIMDSQPSEPTENITESENGNTEISQPNNSKCSDTKLDEKQNIVQTEVKGNEDPSEKMEVLEPEGHNHNMLDESNKACGAQTQSNGDISPIKNPQSNDPDFICTSTPAPAIPPAFANFIENLSKKKPRAVPSSLPLRNSYNSLEERRSPKKVESETTSVCHPLDDHEKVANECPDSATEDCNDVVNSLFTAFGRAESMYQKISNECDNVDSNDVARKHLSNAFISLQDRINQLQLGTVREKDFDNIDMNSSPVLSLLREYSDKLFAMVKEETQKKCLIKE